MTPGSHPVSYLCTHHRRFLAELAEFVRYPSVSAQPDRARDVRACADWLARHLQSIGLERVRVLPTGGHPVVWAEWRRAAGRPTLLVYGHYDVQPTDPLREWTSPPFEPAIRGDSLYGRGTADDKGQLFVHLKALESHLRTSGSLPVNVICLFEGEEEIGSPHLAAFVRPHRPALVADAAVVSDTGILGPQRPALTESLRGALSVELDRVRPGERPALGQFRRRRAQPAAGVVRDPGVPCTMRAAGWPSPVSTIASGR